MKTAIKPWHDEAFELEDDEQEQLWNDVKPSEFYFGFPKIYDSENESYVMFCPIEYFQENGYDFDQQNMLTNLPEYLDLVDENNYEIMGKTVEEVRQDLLNLGFVESQEFNRYISEHIDS